MCRVFIDAGADLHTKDENGYLPLFTACVSGAVEVVKLLVEAGARMQLFPENDCTTCLTIAACGGHTDTVRYVVGLPGVEVNHQDADNKTALHWAVNQNHPDIVQVLIDAGAYIDARDNEGRSPLQSACVSIVGLDNVKLLVRAGAGVRTDNMGSTCLTLAARVGNTDTVRYLVGLPDFDVNDRDGMNHTALYWAIIHGCADVIQVLIDAGADINTKNDHGCAPLHFACCAPVVVKMLVEAGARVCVTDNVGSTCLTVAAQLGYTETVRYLVGLPDVEVNHRGANSQTALQCALHENHQDIAQLLLDAGADMDTDNTDGRSP